ncbi:DUF86 domain-containing protein [Metabacillus halosaccharovorans]|uniref:DUF86 domain-containing protein n=1 Tax=Metabacillus halosaccharovorans TaxID=930124 RepID=A0ABT3DIH8_9BACI|nr:DUF86 domain-containing protein [Metabacillus halosaccharovorans]MCV9886848.1 DUF86 domain-containing protein [Metabacillus halosaccharovorans]
MYFVDRGKIEAKLDFLNKKIKQFEHQSTWGSDLEKAALERICHMLIETIIDVGNAMIDGFIMRDPGSYEDIIDILLDEKVVDEGNAHDLKQVIMLRKKLVQDYIEIDHQELVTTISSHKQGLVSFSYDVRNYLENELGPVSAFIPLNK